MKAEKERVISEREHRSLTNQYLLVQEEHRALEKKLKKSIEKSKSVNYILCCVFVNFVKSCRPYFETRFRCNAKLQVFELFTSVIFTKFSDPEIFPGQWCIVHYWLFNASFAHKSCKIS